MTVPPDLTWIDTPNGYALTIADGVILARNSKGKVLKSVPAAVKKTEIFLDLQDLRTWLQDHDAECGATVQKWLVRSSPVPSTVLAAVWPDETWQSWLRGLFIQPVDEGGTSNAGTAGFLQDVNAANDQISLRILNRDGQTRTLVSEAILIPHPTLIEDLASLQKLAAGLGIQQRFDQLHRAAYELPDPLPDESVTALDTWAGARFDQGLFAVARAHAAGYSIQGDFAVTHIHEDGRLVLAQYRIGAANNRTEESWTGELSWLVNGKTIPVRELGPVAYSEGVRMATRIHDGGTVKENE